MTIERIKEAFAESIAAKQALSEEDLAVLLEMSKLTVEALKRGRKVIFMGNGGSAADAQHLVAELVSRFRLEREGMPAIALTVNTSILTAIGNDYGFEYVFERQVAALAQSGDIVVGLSTSGNSPNVLRAIEKARTMGCLTFGFTGRSGGQMPHAVDLCFSAPSDDTPRIQEVHITAGHILCELVEAEMFG
ncbi:MAG: SIS domain-containing protein [Thermoplasmata archaeon]|nr:SIS domain-containing protein [Thermoplasmata archaeon]